MIKIHPSNNKTTSLMAKTRVQRIRYRRKVQSVPSHTDVGVVGEKIAEPAFPKELWKINREKE